MLKNLCKKSCGVSLPGGENIICYQEGQARHLHLNFIPHQESEKTRQWRLVQVGTYNEIYKSHKEPTTYTEGQQKQQTKMVD